MWQPKKIKFTNLFSHKETEFIFRKDRCIMIYGINSTDEDKDSNGGGKSTVMEAITLALTNETSRDVRKEDFINEEENECYIEFELENKIGDVKFLTIKRWIHRKKAVKVELIENGLINTEMTSVNEANARIFELIGLDKKDLINFFLIGQETNYSFLTASDADKKAIISRLINVDFLNKKIVRLKELSKQKNLEKNALLLDVNSCNTRLEIIDESIQDLKDNFESEKQSQLNIINKKIVKATDDLTKFESDIREKTYNKSLIELDLKKITFDTKTLEEKRANIKICDKNITDLNSHIRKQKTKIKHLQSHLEDAITCPHCKEEFSLDDPETDLKDIPKMIKILEGDNKTYSDMIIEEGKEKLEIENEIQASEDAEEEIWGMKREIKNLDREITELFDDVESSNKSLEKYQKDFRVLKAQKLTDQIKKLKDDKIEWNEMLEVLNDEIKRLDKEIENYEFWIVQLGSRGFTTFLVNKAIKSVEGITNSYLQKINSNVQVQINGYTTLKSGDVNEKISTEIIENGYMRGNFQKYSGGEKGRIKLANILGIQHLINMNCPTGGLNLLCLDEVFEGLDNKGQIAIIKLLEVMNVTSLVVTHRSQPIGTENEIFIEKINRISRIVEKNNIYLSA